MLEWKRGGESLKSFSIFMGQLPALMIIQDTACDAATMIDLDHHQLWCGACMADFSYQKCWVGVDRWTVLRLFTATGPSSTGQKNHPEDIRNHFFQEVKKRQKGKRYPLHVKNKKIIMRRQTRHRSLFGGTVLEIPSHALMPASSPLALVKS